MGTKDNSENRHSARLKLNIPIHIVGYDQNHTRWQEISRILDVSSIGVGFGLQHPVKEGCVLHLSFPMPWKLRQFGHSEPSYKIYGVVRSSTTSAPLQPRVGVAFIGQKPPALYLEKPWIRFNSTEWKDQDRRKSPRKNITEIVWVEYYDTQNHLLGIEQGCTENISRTGARICVQNPPEAYQFVKVFAMGKGFKSKAIVANRYLGEDGIFRLCINFKNSEWNLT